MITAVASLAALASGTTLAAQVRPCELVTSAEIVEITGVAPARVRTEGPTEDKETGATTWDCGWQAGEQFVFIWVIRLRSEAAALRVLTEASQTSRIIPEGVALSKVAGPGDHSLWGASAEGAVWVAQRGTAVLAFVYAGESKSGPVVREPMRKALAAAIGRLP
ncbi:MAG: hypothetical protein AB7L66_18930 [Gemmatimonadales bacterium]